jgi:hypothetical protein
MAITLQSRHLNLPILHRQAFSPHPPPRWPTIPSNVPSLYTLVVYELVSFARQHLFPSGPQTTAPGIMATTLTAGDCM